MSILIIAAHPDDEVLGCGGTIARLAADGESVNILILGEGVSSRSGLGMDEKDLQITQLHKQALRSSQTLGAKHVVFKNLPDNKFDSVPLLEVVKIIEKVIDETLPNVIYTQHGGDLNIDHAITFRATMTAARPMINSSVCSLYSYEVPSSTEWAFQSFSPVFKPSMFVDIATTLKTKLEAISIYEGECRMFPHPRSEQAIRSLAECRGAQSGMKAAEAFEVIYERITL